MAVILPRNSRLSVLLTKRLLRAGLLRYFTHTSHVQQTASRMEVELIAPNGRKWVQPLGLFINNEFVKGSSGQTIASINPTYAGACRRCYG